MGFTFLLHRHSGGRAVNKHRSVPTQHRTITGNILRVRVFCPTPSPWPNPWRITGLYGSVTSTALSRLAYRSLLLYERRHKWRKWSRQGRPRNRKSALIQKISLSKISYRLSITSAFDNLIWTHTHTHAMCVGMTRLTLLHCDQLSRVCCCETINHSRDAPLQIALFIFLSFQINSQRSTYFRENDAFKKQYRLMCITSRRARSWEAARSQLCCIYTVKVHWAGTQRCV